MILAVEHDFRAMAIQFLPILLECMTMQEWTSRKLAIDVIYTMAAILQDVLIPYKKEILEVLNHCRGDKLKPVREATIEPITALKAIPGGDQQNDSLNSEPSQFRSQRDSVPSEGLVDKSNPKLSTTHASVRRS